MGGTTCSLRRRLRGGKDKIKNVAPPKKQPKKKVEKFTCWGCRIPGRICYSPSCKRGRQNLNIEGCSACRHWRQRTNGQREGECGEANCGIYIRTQNAKARKKFKETLKTDLPGYVSSALKSAFE